MPKQRYLLLFIAFLLVGFTTEGRSRKDLYVSSERENDLLTILRAEGYRIHWFDSPRAAVRKAPRGAAVLVLAAGYPARRTEVDEALFKRVREKKLRLYVEYPAHLPGQSVPARTLRTRLERGVVTSPLLGKDLPPMSLLGINDACVLAVEAARPLLVLARVAGFDKAEYGLADVPVHPLLFEREGVLVATTKLSNFRTGRYGPGDAWKAVMAYVVGWASEADQVTFQSWPSDVEPMYGEHETLPADARALSVKKGVEWFDRGKFYVHPAWRDTLLKYQGDGAEPFGPPVVRRLPAGDGSLGLLEGHASKVYHDGTQQYRYWMRADVQGEGALALAAAGSLLENPDLEKRAVNLISYLFQGSNLRAGARAQRDSPSYGLIGWSVTHPHVYYGDDNARAILGVLGASAFLGADRWNREVAEAILANFRTTGRQGFRESRLEEKNLQQFGWQHFQNRDLVNPAPHFESWMWACYLWLYDKTGYAPLLTKAKEGIRITMEGYPDAWKWTNGIQQERARMVLPLAWLVRVEDTPQHRTWLDTVVREILANQTESGAIREELGGAGRGRYGPTKSNREYGLHEAPLIFKNGDPIADMLYTSNFAFFSLNEAAQATRNPQYGEAVRKLSDFLTRIQVRSSAHPDLDGAWFRAFDYDRWEYWASNADAGWGAWGTLTGWTQSWIVATQVLTAQHRSFWELTRDSSIAKEMAPTLEAMLPE